MKSVDHRVAGDMYGGRVNVLAEQCVGSRLCWCEVQSGKAAHDLAVDLFGPGVVDVAATQAGFHVGDRYPAIVGGQGTGHRGGSVALHDDPIGPLVIKHPSDPGEQSGGQPVERLVGLHQIKIVVRRDARDLQHLIQHSAMLSGHADTAVEARVGIKRMNQREQLDRFGPGAEDGKNLARHARGINQARLTARYP